MRGMANLRVFRSLYRRSLKLALDWAVHRHIWRGQAVYIRSLFDANKNVRDPRQQQVLPVPLLFVWCKYANTTVAKARGENRSFYFGKQKSCSRHGSTPIRIERRQLQAVRLNLDFEGREEHFTDDGIGSKYERNLPPRDLPCEYSLAGSCPFPCVYD